MASKLSSDATVNLTYQSKDMDREGMLITVRETRRVFSDQGWSTGTCEEAFWRMWRNQKDDRKRDATGTKASHRSSAKRLRRKKAKLHRREKLLQSIDWPERRKARVAAVLSLDCTSPAESDEDDHNLLHNIPFCWESDKLRVYKRSLDAAQLSTATARTLNKSKSLVRHPTKRTEGPVPSGTPQWAIKQ